MTAMTERTCPRVLHIDDGRLWRGGQHQVWLLMRELAGRGVVQQLAAQAGRALAARARAAGLQVDEIPLCGELDFLAPRRLTDLARCLEANILHARQVVGGQVDPIGGEGFDDGRPTAHRLLDNLQLDSQRPEHGPGCQFVLGHTLEDQAARVEGKPQIPTPGAQGRGSLL